MTIERRMFRRDTDLEVAPGTIVAEFSNGTLALNFMKYCLPPGYTVTAGINMVFAVRKVCVHPIKHLRAVDGHSECGACGVALESADCPPSVADARPAQNLSERGRGFTLQEFTPKGQAGIAHIERVLGTLEVVDDTCVHALKYCEQCNHGLGPEWSLPHGSNSL